MGAQENENSFFTCYYKVVLDRFFERKKKSCPKKNFFLKKSCPRKMFWKKKVVLEKCFEKKKVVLENFFGKFFFFFKFKICPR